MTYPLDTLRTNLMIGNSVKGIFSKPSSLFNGIGISLLGSLPAGAVYLSSYDYLKSEISKSGKLSETPNIFLSGFLAECISGFVWCPTEVLKQTLQANPQMKTREVFQLIRQNGGFLRGYLPTLLVFGPYSSTFFFVFESLQKRISKLEHPNHTHITIVENALAAAFASGIAAAVSCPADVIKTRVQVLNFRPNESTGVSHVIKEIFRKEGFKGFFRGVIPRVLWIAPSSAITLSSYHYLKRILATNSA